MPSLPTPAAARALAATLPMALLLAGCSEPFEPRTHNYLGVFGIAEYTEPYDNSTLMSAGEEMGLLLLGEEPSSLRMWNERNTFVFTRNATTGALTLSIYFPAHDPPTRGESEEHALTRARVDWGYWQRDFEGFVGEFEKITGYAHVGNFTSDPVFEIRK